MQDHLPSHLRVALTQLEGACVSTVLLEWFRPVKYETAVIIERSAEGGEDHDDYYIWRWSSRLAAEGGHAAILAAFRADPRGFLAEHADRLS